MTIRDWWWEYASRAEEARDLQDIANGKSKFRGPEWDDARRRHKEKMKNGASSKSSN